MGALFRLPMPYLRQPDKTQKSAGRNLDEAYDQASDYFDGMNGGPIAFQGFPPIRRSGEEATNRLRDEVRAVAPAKKQPFSMR